MLMHVVLVWTLSGAGVNRLFPPVIMALSEMLVPLLLFSDWLQLVLNWQPFRGLVDVPYRIYNGDIPVMDAFPDIVHQCGSTLLFILMGQYLLSRSIRRLVIHGG